MRANNQTRQRKSRWEAQRKAAVEFRNNFEQKNRQYLAKLKKDRESLSNPAAVEIKDKQTQEHIDNAIKEGARNETELNDKVDEILRRADHNMQEIDSRIQIHKELAKDLAKPLKYMEHNFIKVLAWMPCLCISIKYPGRAQAEKYRAETATNLTTNVTLKLQLNHINEKNHGHYYLEDGNPDDVVGEGDCAFAAIIHGLAEQKKLQLLTDAGLITPKTQDELEKAYGIPTSSRVTKTSSSASSSTASSSSNSTASSSANSSATSSSSVSAVSTSSVSSAARPAQPSVPSSSDLSSAAKPAQPSVPSSSDVSSATSSSDVSSAVSTSSASSATSSSSVSAVSTSSASSAARPAPVPSSSSASTEIRPAKAQTYKKEYEKQLALGKGLNTKSDSKAKSKDQLVSLSADQFITLLNPMRNTLATQLVRFLIDNAQNQEQKPGDYTSFVYACGLQAYYNICDDIGITYDDEYAEILANELTQLMPDKKDGLTEENKPLLEQKLAQSLTIRKASGIFAPARGAARSSTDFGTPMQPLEIGCSA